MNLSEIMTQVRGLSYSKKDSHNIYFEDSIPVLRAGNIQNARILQEDYVYVSNDLVKDKQYLEGMIEHHSMGVLTSEEILKKTDNYDVAKLAKNII